MAQFERHFTLDEANALVPRVRSIFDKVHRLVRDLALPAAGKVQPPSEGEVKPLAPGGNGHPANGAKVVDMETVWQDLGRQEKMQLINSLLQALIDDGIIIQDVERGLVDFPAWRGDEEVLLCYELADGEGIAAWHDLTSGFAGRLRIAEWTDGLA